MSVDELSEKYMCLRADLARAYGEPVWNSDHIDILTEAIADTEFALAASGEAPDVSFSAHRSMPSAAGTSVAHP